MTTAPKVLIVGGGPSGLVLAICLLQNGIPVRIIEKNACPCVGQRGAGIMPRSLELFTVISVIDRVLNRAIQPPPVRKYDTSGTQVIQEYHLHPPRKPTPTELFSNPVLLGQARLEEMLRTVLDELGYTVELGTELESFEQFEDHVEVKLRVTATNFGTEDMEEITTFEYVVGADGARSTVRKKLGLSFLGETRSTENYVVGDIRVEGLSSKYWHMWGDATSTMVSLRGTHEPNLFSFFIVGGNTSHAEVVNDPDQLRKFLAENTGNREDLEFGECTWISTFTPNIRMVEKFCEGRVFLVGDSAHVHSPTGGQGLNTGIQDSFNLAWKLALVLKRIAPPSLLGTYTEERFPVVAEMLIQTTKAHDATLGDGKQQKWERDVGLLQLGVNYRWSSIVLDGQRILEARQEVEDDGFMTDYGSIRDQKNEAVVVNSYGNLLDGRLRAGDRAPNACGLVDYSAPRTAQDLFRIFGSHYHTVLIFSDIVDPIPIIEVSKSYPAGMVRTVIITPKNQSALDVTTMSADIVLQDEDGHAQNAYIHDRTCGVVIVRPDGVVGAIVQDRRWLCKYFSGVFADDARASEPGSSTASCRILDSSS